jgi:diaminopimelate epimerase
MNVGVSQKIHFFKMTGTGNDFILIDNRNGLIDSDHCQDLVRRACRHNLSVGADGLILIENDPEVDFKWRFFNADASEGEMCGNGARCVARFAFLAGIVKKPVMAFRTLAGIIRAELIGDKAKVQMPPPYDLKMNIELESAGRSFKLYFLNTGVPHAVCFVESEKDLESADVERWGRALRYHPYFQPAGTNVDFVYVKDARHLNVRTYERGVEGETLACGTGCVASALIASARNLVNSPAEATTRSDELLTIHFEISREPQDYGKTRFKEVFLEGAAQVVYEADLWTETI